MIRALLLCSALAATSLAAPSVLSAQTSAAGTATATGRPSQEELLPLNFYVQQRDDASIRAELRRLQLKYPGWTPPADLGRLAVTTPSAEIDQIYRQIAAGQFTAARSSIAATRADFPDWTPPEELTRLLATSEAQSQLDQALATDDMGRALDLAYATPGLLRCDRINNAWRIADGQRASGRNADALATYRAVLNACTAPKDLQATLEKASTLASVAELEALFLAVETRLPAQRQALLPLRLRLLPAEAASAEVAAQPTGKPSKAPSAAASSGATAVTPAPAKTKSSAGAAPTGQGRSAAAGTGGGSGDWRSCLARTAGTQQTGQLYERGWCAYNLDQSMEALSAFRGAIAGKLAPEQRRDAHFGLALSYLKLNLPNEAARIAAAIDLSTSQRVEVEGQILNQRGVNAYNKKDYAGAIAYFNALEQVRGGIARDLAMLRAYAYLNSGHRPEARRQFEVLNRQLSTQETRRALQAAIAN